MAPTLPRQMDSDIPVFARRLKQARHRIGLSQYALGVAAGIDEMSASPRVNQYERGKHAPDFQMAARMAVVLMVPTAFLYTDDDEIAQALLLLGPTSTAQRQRMIEALRHISENTETAADIPGSRH